MMRNQLPRCQYCNLALGHYPVTFTVTFGDRTAAACPPCAQGVLDRLSVADAETMATVEDMWAAD